MRILVVDIKYIGDCGEDVLNMSLVMYYVVYLMDG